MNRRLLLSITVACGFTLGFAFCNTDKKDQRAEDKTSPITVSELSAPFTESFSQLLKSYFELQKAFAESDTLKANAAAASLQLNSESLKVSSLQGDSTGTIKETAEYYAGTLASSAKSLMGQQDLEKKLREFNTISDAMWSLTRTVQYDAEKLYYHYCSMAFDNMGAYWVSNSREVHNPYLGENIKNCGEVTDSLDYRN